MFPEYWYEPETRIDGGAGTAIKVETNDVRISGLEVSTAGTAAAILASINRYASFAMPAASFRYARTCESAANGPASSCRAFRIGARRR